jgi:hypothetical protein
LFLGQIQLLTTASEPLAEMQGEVLLAGGKAGCLRIARSHFPDPFEFEDSSSDFLIVLNLDEDSNLVYHFFAR